jgi:plasmid stabilization system protein ParE
MRSFARGRATISSGSSVIISWNRMGFQDILIFYLMADQTLRVVRVLHGRRDVGRILEAEPADDDED